MKRHILLALVSLLAMVACKQAPQYTIKGNYGSGNDTLYLFGTDSRYDKVTAIACDEQGDFSISIKTDTILPLGLILPNNEIIMLFGEPDTEATIINDELDNSRWIAKGGKQQVLYDSIAAILSEIPSNSGRIVHIDNFIKQHPFGDANVEIIRRFLVETPSPNNSFVQSRIKNLGGTLQDHEFFTGIKEKVENRNSNTAHKMFPAVDTKDINGKRVATKSYKDKLMVVNFWASWDSTSLREMKELSKLYAATDTNKVMMLNISLDYDTAAWRKCVEQDSIAGVNICTGKAWNDETVKKFSISNLTFSVLVSPYQRIDMFYINKENFDEAINSGIEKYFNKEKNKRK